ncbi:lysophospholipid acyltransferase family protein [Polymorphobacter sp.]|uniref:lysophospholipid acyltransferase family protein n=1 Tax=Polymorphobacter sp. TaxID=1909290 RepID=UPI003F71682B
MALLRTLLFLLVFYAGTVPIVLGTLLFSLFAEGARFIIPHLWGRWFLLCTRVILGIRLRIEGALPREPALIAIKHQSAYETIALLALFDRPATVMKAELQKIPFWGWAAARQGAIFVDRQGSASSLRAMMRAAQAAVAARRPIVIFPEGTRVPPGQTPPLAAGFAGLYKISRLPVIPIALDSGRVWTRDFVKRPGVVTMRIHDSIEPGLPRDAIEARVHAAINNLEG